MDSPRNPFYGLADRIIQGTPLTRIEALTVLEASSPWIPFLFAEANRVRHHFFKDNVTLCSIINIKSGKCSEDCTYCAQSGHYRTGITEYPLIGSKKVTTQAKRSATWGSHLGLVSSGKSLLNDSDFDALIHQIQTASPHCETHASLGLMNTTQAMALKNAGITTYHHNIETSRAYFPKVTTTHTYEDRLKTIQSVKAAGLRLCCGGILGMGESVSDRIDMAFEIRDIAPDAIPLNFLRPIPGTPLEHQPLISPMDALKAVALFRLINPATDIKICGGRSYNLRDLQSMLFMAGASGLMIGDYLTTPGRDAALDLTMIKDLGLTHMGCHP